MNKTRGNYKSNLYFFIYNMILIRYHYRIFLFLTILVELQFINLATNLTAYTALSFPIKCFWHSLNNLVIKWFKSLSTLNRVKMSYVCIYHCIGNGNSTLSDCKECIMHWNKVQATVIWWRLEKLFYRFIFEIMSR